MFDESIGVCKGECRDIERKIFQGGQLIENIFKVERDQHAVLVIAHAECTARIDHKYARSGFAGQRSIDAYSF